jgi:ATP-dependent DNA helicase RecG
MLILGYMKRHLELDWAKAADLVQRSEEEAGEVLSTMVRDGLLDRIGVGRSALYQLAMETAEVLGVSSLGRLPTPADQEARVLAYLRERGKITNQECQQVCGISPSQAFKLLARMVATGKVRAEGKKRGRLYMLPE